MSILFLHGLEGSPHGTKARYLKKEFGESAVITPAWRVSGRVADCLEAIVQSTAQLPKDDELVAVGSSFGGYLASLLPRRIHQIVGLVLINPAMVGGPNSKLSDLFSDLESFPIQKNEDYVRFILLGNQDEICDPDATQAFFEGCPGIRRLDDDHRFSRPESLKLIAESIRTVESHWFIGNLDPD